MGTHAAQLKRYIQCVASDTCLDIFDYNSAHSRPILMIKRSRQSPLNYAHIDIKYVTLTYLINHLHIAQNCAKPTQACSCWTKMIATQERDQIETQLNFEQVDVRAGQPLSKFGHTICRDARATCHEVRQKGPKTSSRGKVP